jgi:hypothetical protein
MVLHDLFMVDYANGLVAGDSAPSMLPVRHSSPFFMFLRRT